MYIIYIEKEMQSSLDAPHVYVLHLHYVGAIFYSLHFCEEIWTNINRITISISRIIAK